MPGIVINGRQYATPFPVLSWLDDARFRLRRPDVFPRSSKLVHLIGDHTTKGWPDPHENPTPQSVRPGAGPSGGAARVAASWSMSDDSGGAHFLDDHDGVIYQLADIATEAASHIVGLNDVSIGIEYFQGSQSELYEVQLARGVMLHDFLTKLGDVPGCPVRFAFQRQITAPPYRNRAMPRLLPEKKGGTAGRDVVGVIGHRDASDNRGAGDPGDFIMQSLAAAGYEPLIDAAGRDLIAWQQRQRDMGIAADGIPGPHTRAALEQLGKLAGQWVTRPGDELPLTP